MKTLTGPGVHLRAVEVSDVPLLTRWVADQEVTATLLMGRFPMNQLVEEEWVRAVTRSKNDVVYVIALNDGGTPIGMCGLHGIDWVDRFGVAGIAIYEKEHQGKRLGTEAMRLLCTHAFHVLNLRRVELSVYDYNVRAQRSYLSLGFKEEGRMKARRFKNGRYCDEILMAVFQEDWPQPE